jgi:membrane-associated phospholipid phosphatase
MKSLLQQISIVDFTNLSFLIIIVSFYFITFNNTPYKLLLLFIYPLLFLFLLFIIWFRKLEISVKRKKNVLFIYPIIFLFSIFETLFMILPYFNQSRYDELLTKIDFMIFGFHPTVWIEQWVSKGLTELMYLFYFFYFPMPLIILIWMFLKEKYQDIEKSFFIFLNCYYIAYIIYFFVPALGPRFYLNQFQTVELSGYFLSEPIGNLINILEPNKLDAFPSLHSAILLTTMLVTLKYNKKMFYFFMPFAIGITISLVYCRYHYVIDVIAGFVLSGLNYWLFGKIYNKIHSKYVLHFGD